MANKRKGKYDTNKHNSSPKKNKTACLCKDGSYSRECCDGELQSQGIGSVDGDNSVSAKSNSREPRTKNVNRS